MYDWLYDALDDNSCLVTANRRLARELQSAWGEGQIARGVSAWRTPEIRAWPSWLATVVSEADAQVEIPTRINAQQSRVIWERCLRKELGDDVVGLPSLVRLARDARQRLTDANVSIRDVARTAQTEDQRLFAAAAGRYQALLEHQGWVDDAGLAALALSLVRAGHTPVRGAYVFAGFDRLNTSASLLLDALRESGADVSTQAAAAHGADPEVFEFERRDVELRAAGAWARRYLGEHPGARIAIVTQGLEQSAARDARLVREGCVPGWQYGAAALRDAVNVSYGRRLDAYPAVAIALLVLRWLIGDLRSTEVARLLLSPMTGDDELPGRSRLELQLRERPDRAWSPAMVTAALRASATEGDADDWLGRVAALAKRRREIPGRASPADWVLLFDETLRAFGWPGAGTLDSNSYQLINRWRELLNDFARLDLVSASMTPAIAVSQIEIMAGEVVFQPESRGASVQLIGPLEATGAEFDAVWLAGMTATDWPPPGRPSPLLSRRLQVEHGMPDATPEDTRAWTEKTFQRIAGSAPNVVCSYPTTVDDVEQSASDLLHGAVPVAPPRDPGWHAVELSARAQTKALPDPVPALRDERVFGGAATVQRQLSEPFAAFVQGRLGARFLDRQAVGIPAWLRGNLVHDTLYRAYQQIGGADELRAIDDRDLRNRVAAAADGALQRHERNADAVLRSLLRLERERLVDVVCRFVAIDRSRIDFRIAALEGAFEFEYRNLRLQLRFDRLDRFGDGKLAIIDYKTGSTKQLLARNGDVYDAQLFVYAMAADDPVAMLALANVDAPEPGFSGAGRGFTDEGEWPDLLATVGDTIRAACDDLLAGDVRLLAAQGAASARRFNLLSRYTELRHEN